MKQHHAFTFDRKPVPGAVPIMVTSTFEASDDGQLRHYTDGRLRAEVPPEGWDAYAEQWPDSRAMVNELKGKPVVEQTIFIGADALAKQAELVK